MAYMVTHKQTVKGYTLEQLKHEIMLRWMEGGKDTFIPYLTLKSVSPDGLKMGEEMRSGITLRLDVSRGEDVVGVVFLVNRRRDEIEVTVGSREGPDYLARVAKAIDEIVQEAGLTDLERFYLRAVRERPSERGELEDYCNRAGFSEQTLRNKEKEFRARGFDTGPNW